MAIIYIKVVAPLKLINKIFQIYFITIVAMMSMAACDGKNHPGFSQVTQSTQNDCSHNIHQSGGKINVSCITYNKKTLTDVLSEYIRVGIKDYHKRRTTNKIKRVSTTVFFDPPLSLIALFDADMVKCLISEIENTMSPREVRVVIGYFDELSKLDSEDLRSSDLRIGLINSRLTIDSSDSDADPDDTMRMLGDAGEYCFDMIGPERMSSYADDAIERNFVEYLGYWTINRVSFVKFFDEDLGEYYRFYKITVEDDLNHSLVVNQQFPIFSSNEECEDHWFSLSVKVALFRRIITNEYFAFPSNIGKMFTDPTCLSW